jgi:hypothetical protein
MDIIGPGGSNRFGATVVVLPNGHIVVTAPGTGSEAGAAYLYDAEGALISQLAGTHAGDRVGDDGVIVLANGNYALVSTAWNGGRGAVTWGDADAGVSGEVSADNSLVGDTADDRVGTEVVALANGNYIVRSPSWDNAGADAAGAVTWGDGESGTHGSVSAANSIVGSAAGQQIGSGGVFELANGHFVISSPRWSDGTYSGAVTWASGIGGTHGAVSIGNSLVSTEAYDLNPVTPLTNGNYVVGNPHWNEARGAATWLDGSGPFGGAVSADNSLVGSMSGDDVGEAITALSNGHYVVSSPWWSSGGQLHAGAATWRDGGAANPDVVSAAISLVGSSVDDFVGQVTALANGNYVVSSSHWDHGPVEDTGAVTWCNGTTGMQGAVTDANSLVGAEEFDYVGGNSLLGVNHVVALSGGNYVVVSGGADAATLGDGVLGTVGTVNAANSFMGVTDVVALRDDAYVIANPLWQPGPNALPDWGAVTWADGNAGIVGEASSSNSVVGPSSYDQVGSNGITPLADGSFAVFSSSWGGGIGAVTGGHARRGVQGTVGPANSITGSGPIFEKVSDVALLTPSSLALLTIPVIPPPPPYREGVTFIRSVDSLVNPRREGDTVYGMVAGADDLTYAFNTARDELVVGKPYENIVTIQKVDTLLRSGFD